jgi:hypothetical protein
LHLPGPGPKPVLARGVLSAEMPREETSVVRCTLVTLGPSRAIPLGYLQRSWFGMRTALAFLFALAIIGSALAQDELDNPKDMVPRSDPPGQDAPSYSVSSLWRHNSSTVALVAEGSRRRFLYEDPRVEMRRRGVERGTLLFDGEVVGRTYSGTAYIFPLNCGPRGYAVAGAIASGDRRVVLRGKAPRIDQTCREIGLKDDELVFEYLRQP